MANAPPLRTRTNRNRKLPGRFNNGDVQLTGYNPQSDQNPSTSSDVHNNATASSSATPSRALVDKTNIPKPNQNDSMPRPYKKRKITKQTTAATTSDREAEQRTVLPSIEVDASHATVGPRPTMRAAPKKRGRHAKKKSPAPLPAPPGRELYLVEVEQYYDEEVAIMKSMERKHRFLSYLGVRTKRTQKPKEIGDDSLSTPNEDNFSTSDEEVPPPEPLRGEGPSIFLADLKIDLAEAIYKQFATDCATHYGGEWLAWLNKLLWMNTRDFLWVDNMKRVFQRQEPYNVIPKEEIIWHNLQIYREEEWKRGENPRNADWEWTQEECYQEDQLFPEDLELAKKYTAERGIPWEKVLYCCNDVDMAFKGGEEKVNEGNEEADSNDTIAPCRIGDGNKSVGQASGG